MRCLVDPPPQVKASICENINLFLRIAEENIVPHVQGFATAVWHLLLQAREGGHRRARACAALDLPSRSSVVLPAAPVCGNFRRVVVLTASAPFLSPCAKQVGQEPTKDELATEAIRFLTSIANSVHNGLFKASLPPLSPPPRKNPTLRGATPHDNHTRKLH